MSYLYVKWNSSECSSLADVYAIKACLRFAGHSRNEACGAVRAAFRPECRV